MKDFSDEDFQHNVIHSLRINQHGKALVQMAENIVRYIDKKEAPYQEEQKYVSHSQVSIMSSYILAESKTVKIICMK